LPILPEYSRLDWVSLKHTANELFQDCTDYSPAGRDGPGRPWAGPKI